MPGIMLIGEAWGKDEAEAQQAFVGASGRFLNAMLYQAGIARRDCYVTNVFNVKPEPTNDVKNLCGPKADRVPGFPALQSGKYVRNEYAGELTRLFEEIKREDPDLIIALGATPTWALLGTSGIRKYRGTPSLLMGPALAAVGRPIKVFPTYHPAAVIREHSLRPIVIADLEKAKAESEYREIRRPQREIWIEPTLADLAAFEQRFIIDSPDLSIDIETAGDQITCVGFAPTVDRAIVIPFVDPLQPDGNYWRTLADELKAWDFVRRWCAMHKRILGQNHLYDIHFLWRQYGIPMPYASDDTMLLHHALQPEMEKGLGFLGSIYTKEASWKFMRAKHETVKKED